MDNENVKEAMRAYLETITATSGTKKEPAETRELRAARFKILLKTSGMELYNLASKLEVSEHTIRARWMYGLQPDKTQLENLKRLVDPASCEAETLSLLSTLLNPFYQPLIEATIALRSEGRKPTPASILGGIEYMNRHRRFPQLFEPEVLLITMRSYI